jgi:hypothetical protein
MQFSIDTFGRMLSVDRRDIVNATAGRKAFILTRIGDIAFGIAIALFFLIFGQFSIFSINSSASSLSGGMGTLLALLLLAGVGNPLNCLWPSGYQMPWQVLRLSPPSFTQQRWLRLAHICS